MTRFPDSPRISANDLALYMVSSDTARLGIIKRAAEPQTFVVTRYRDVRPPVKAFLTDLARSNRHLLQAEDMFAQRADDAAETPIRQDDARQSIEVLRSLGGMSNQLSSFSFHDTPQSQPKLMLAGVEVSVRADLWVYGAARGVEQIGGALLRMTQDDAETPSAAAKRREMGLYVATLMRLHVDSSNPGDRVPANRLCMSIDIRHGQVFTAPAANARRMSDVEAACRSIAALWGTV